MYKKKTLLKNISIIISSCFLCGILAAPAAAADQSARILTKLQADDDSLADRIAVLNALRSAEDITPEERQAIKTIAFDSLTDSFQQLANADIPPMVPNSLAGMLATMQAIASGPGDTETKIAALVQAYQSTCVTFATIWAYIDLYFWIVNPILPIPLPSEFISILSFTSDIAFWAAVLCFLGVI